MKNFFNYVLSSELLDNMFSNFNILNDNIVNLDFTILNDYITNGYNEEFLDILYIISMILAVNTIINRNPVVSVLFLICLFVTIAFILLLVGINYIGLSYILVYVGAVSILFLFILMLINIRISELLSEINNNTPLAVLIIFLFFYIIGQVLPSNSTDNTTISIFKLLNSPTIADLYQQIVYVSSIGWDNTLIEFTQISGIGNIMYTNYSIWLIESSVILLLGMVGAIIITIKQNNKQDDESNKIEK